ncbi:hypothetical protein [Holzapfeliella sp. JNUCC 72]
MSVMFLVFVLISLGLLGSGIYKRNKIYVFIGSVMFALALLVFLYFIFLPENI